MNKKTIGIEYIDVYMRFPEIMEEEFDDLLEFLKDEHIRCEGATDLFIDLQQENKQLKDNWNKLKEIAKSQSGFKKRADLKGGLWFEVDELLETMQELEQESDSNE